MFRFVSGTTRKKPPFELVILVVLINILLHKVVAKVGSVKREKSIVSKLNQQIKAKLILRTSNSSHKT